MDKLRVAVFNTQPPHLYFGGVETRIVEIARELSGTVATTVFSGTKKGFKKAIAVDGVSFVPCSSTDRFFPLDNWSFNRTISRMFDKVQADVFEAHAVSGYGFLNALLKRDLSSRFIATIHGPLVEEYLQSGRNPSPSIRTRLSNLAMWQLARVERKLARNASHIVAVSRYSMEKIVRHYDVAPQKIRIVPNGVDCDRFRPTVSSDAIERTSGTVGKRRVLFVGQLVPRKGLPFLVEAAQEIVRERKDTVFVLVGGGPLRNSLVDSLSKKGLLEYFVFLGEVSGEVLPSLYTSADVFVLPSITEAQGIVLLEAQAAGKPVVAFDVGAISESMINKETGFLVKPGEATLAGPILELLSNNALREKMGDKGRDFVCSNFSWTASAEKMLQVYREVAS